MAGVEVIFGVFGKGVRPAHQAADLLPLVEALDRKTKPGSEQARGQSGHFQRKASNDALGKSAEKTSEQLHTSVTKIERIRYVLKYADSGIKLQLTQNKITLNRAWEQAKQKQAKPSKEPKGTKATKGGKSGTQKKPAADPLPFELTPGLDVAFALWNPVRSEQAALSTGPEAQPDAAAQVKYTLDEPKLTIAPDAKTLKALTNNRRVQVSSGSSGGRITTSRTCSAL